MFGSSNTYSPCVWMSRDCYHCFCEYWFQTLHILSLPFARRILRLKTSGSRKPVVHDRTEAQFVTASEPAICQVGLVGVELSDCSNQNWWFQFPRIWIRDNSFIGLKLIVPGNGIRIFSSLIALRHTWMFWLVLIFYYYCSSMCTNSGSSVCGRRFWTNIDVNSWYILVLANCKMIHWSFWVTEI